MVQFFQLFFQGAGKQISVCCFFYQAGLCKRLKNRLIFKAGCSGQYRGLKQGDYQRIIPAQI